MKYKEALIALIYAEMDNAVFGDIQKTMYFGEEIKDVMRRYMQSTEAMAGELDEIMEEVTTRLTIKMKGLAKVRQAPTDSPDIKEINNNNGVS